MTCNSVIALEKKNPEGAIELMRCILSDILCWMLAVDHRYGLWDDAGDEVWVADCEFVCLVKCGDDANRIQLCCRF